MSGDDPEHAEQQLRQRAKLALRARMRAVRATLPQSACHARSERIERRVLALEEAARSTTVLAFSSIRNEVKTGDLIDALRVEGKRVALPRVVEDELELRLVEEDTELVRGAFSVPEPGSDAERIEPEKVDFALIPARAVDPRGHRIGYGGGYYDRLLPKLSRACTCAIVYDFQLIAEVPVLPFDVAVKLIVTDARVIHVR